MKRFRSAEGGAIVIESYYVIMIARLILNSYIFISEVLDSGRNLRFRECHSFKRKFVPENKMYQII